MAPRKPLAPMTADMLERLAARSVQPIKSPTAKKTTIPYDPTDPFAHLGLSKKGASTAATNVPGDKPFTGPTLDPDIISAREELKVKGAQAIEAGIPQSTVESIAAGKQEPRGFEKAGGIFKAVGGFVVPDVIPFTRVDISESLQPVKRALIGDPELDDPTTEKIEGQGLLGKVAPTLDKLDIGRRFITSTLKETRDAVQGGKFSTKDWKEQTFAGAFGVGTAEQELGYGELVGNLTGNAYIDQLIGFAGDVLLDPLTYVVGPGGIAKTAAGRGLLQSGKSAAKTAARYAVKEGDRAAAVLAKEVAKEVILDPLASSAQKSAARAQIKAADAAINEATKALSQDAATREFGRRARETLAQQVVGVKDEAKRVIAQTEQVVGKNRPLEEIQQGVAAGAGTKLYDDLVAGGLDPETIATELGNARATVNALTPQVIADINKRGLAGLYGSYYDILRNVQTPAQQVLGVRGGLRIYNPLDMAGIGPRRVRLGGPASEILTNAAGKLVAGRLNIGKTALGTKLLNSLLTPTGEGGLFGEEDLLNIRRSLRTGNVSPQVAEEYTRLLGLDNAYRSFVENERLQAVGFLNQSGVPQLDRATVNSVLPYLQSDPATWAGRLPALTPEQQIAYDTVKNLMEGYYDAAAKAGGATGYEPRRIENYFPQMQSERALNWAARNPEKAEQLAKRLKVDRTWFLGNFRERTLKKGDYWFGYKLQEDDLKQGVIKLNEIARRSTHPDGSINPSPVNFDFFETDVNTALQKYADKHAQFVALQRAMGEAPERVPSSFVRGTTVETVVDEGAPPISEFVSPVRVTPTTPPAQIAEELRALKGGPADVDEITGIPASIQPGRLSAEALAASTPEQLMEVTARIRNLAERLRLPLVQKESFLRDLDELGARMDQLTADAALLPADERSRLLTEMIESGRLEAEQLSNELAELPLNIPKPDRWVEYVDVVEKGIVGLNPETLPEIGAREWVAEMFQNARRLEDAKFRNAFVQFIKWYTGFSKANFTLRPGFHTRNAYSNAFQLLVAGANPASVIAGSRVFKTIRGKVRNGATVREAIRDLVDNPGPIAGVIQETPVLRQTWLKASRSVEERQALINALEDAYNASGSTGFGQAGELTEVLKTGEKGPLLLRTPERGPLIGTRKAVGKVFAGSRKVGTGVENFFRFGLLYDGLTKGLSPQEAAARVDRYLLNYKEFSKLDRAARVVFPFWTFMSRNAPLQLQLQFTNPRAYQYYNNLRRSAEEQEENSIVVPQYEASRGVFPTVERGFGAAIPLRAIRPGLPFEGGGEETLSNLIREPQKLLASVNPLFRAPTEAILTGFIDRPYNPELGQYGGAGYQFFTGFPIASEEDVVRGRTAQKAVGYLIRELFSPTSPIRAVVSFLPTEMRETYLASLLGVRVDEFEPELQQLQAFLNWAGIPIADIKTSSQRRELERRTAEIAKKIDDVRRKRYYEQREVLEEGSTTNTETTETSIPYNPNDPFAHLGLSKLNP